jgi:putative cardiolipin synthase
MNPSRLGHQALLALLFLLSTLLCACAGLPPRGTPEPSHAQRDTAQTGLGRIAAASRPADEAAPSGFRLLPTGEFAFNARLALARRAERTLDAQCYHIQRDHAGRALLRELRDAAKRGVRVRLLVDDFYAAEIDDLLLGLAAHPNVQVRLFNPLPLRRGAPVLRLLLSSMGSGRFQQLNHRMHNKLYIADNQFAIFGGRNVADEYFMSHREANFIDMDLIGTGAVVDDFSSVFDRYWNSEVAWPLHAVLPPAADAAAERAAFDAEVRDAAPLIPRYRTDPFGQTAVEVQLDEGRVVQSFAAAQVHADPPEKALDPGLLKAPTTAMRSLLDAMSGARRYVAITSPYFVPNDDGMARMRMAHQHGVKVVLVTNSLGSTDEPLVHDHYSRRRAELLAMGVDIYEFSPKHTQRSQGFGAFGKSVPRLHAKVAIVDQKRLLVGSVNLDARSAIGNTEMGVVIDSPELATRLSRLVTGTQFANMYKLRLAEDGRTVEWLSREADGSTAVTRDEPAGSAWLRFKLWLQSLIVDPRLL